MAITIEGSANPVELQALRGMFEARKQVFVDLLKWKVPVVEGRFELDEFDDEHAVYIIVSDSAGSHRASARLLKTERPHILSSLFPDLCSGTVPAGPDMLEITRFCLDRRQTAAERLAARNRLVTALVSHALRNGIAAYTGVAELAWLQQILAFGWSCRPLGLPRPKMGPALGALQIDISPETPALLARTGMWAPSVAADGDIREAA